MSEKSFPAPVCVKTAARNIIIASVWDAVEYLKGWPAKRGREYRIALQHCMDALDGLRSPRKAWHSFMTAAKAAGLLAG